MSGTQQFPGATSGQTAGNVQLEKPTRSLVRKLCEVMASVGWIEKTGYNEFHKYSYAQEADLVNALRKELASRHLFIFPNVRKVARLPHEVETMKWDDKAKAKVPTIRKTQLTEIEVEWTFVDGESGEERTVIVHGVGEDNVDKGFYKAFTGSEKYMLMKSFLIPTGDDPEKESKEEREESKHFGREAAQNVAQEKIASLRASQSQEPPIVDETAALFYVWHDESQTAQITGHKGLMKLNEDILRPLKIGKELVANANQLEDLKYQLERRNTPFRQLKSL